MSTTIEGHCLCGAVTVELTAPGGEISACHCSMCRRWGGAAFLGVSGETFEIAGRTSVSSYTSSDIAERAFCKTCGTNLWYRYIPGDHYSFLAGLFAAEDVIGWTMKEEIFVDDQPAYYGFVGDQPRLTAAEVKEKYGVG